MHFEATITSKGQITLPARLREKLNLKDGDKVEFYLDHLGRVMMRPRNRSAKGFLSALEPRKPETALASDDEAIALSIEEKDARSRRIQVGAG
jgi:antitoxin PrlF